MDLVEYVLAFLLSAVPVSHHAYVEPENVTLERYASVAEDIARVANDPDVEPVFQGPDGRTKTALMLASIASLESHLRGDVDTCRVRGDGGRSATIFQLQRAPKSACQDREEAVRIALFRLRESVHVCRRKPAEERLSLYASGSCERGQPASRQRWKRAERWLKAHPRVDETESDAY